MSAYPSTDAVRDLIAAFESHELPHADWTHRAHLTVAAWYVLWYGPDAALDHVRDGIRAHNAAHGIVQTPTGGYHETITRFYVWLVSRAVRRSGVSASLGDIVNRVVDECTDREIPYGYYSRERLMSGDARRGWVEPDLAALD
ncbi:MAG TPA: hypothetical protein VFA43_14010 [Gemmatimonadaceae bacterium]|nr:hypothetical protein [Gemmatimonadaceae bacterium]